MEQEIKLTEKQYKTLMDMLDFLQETYQLDPEKNEVIELIIEQRREICGICNEIYTYNTSCNCSKYNLR